MWYFLNNALNCFVFCFCSAVSVDTWYPAAFVWKPKHFYCAEDLLASFADTIILLKCWIFSPGVKLQLFNQLQYSLTLYKDDGTWFFLCIWGKCGEWNFSGTIPYIPFHFSGPILRPPVKCLYLCVHISQPFSIFASAFNHCPPEAQKYHLLQFLLPWVSKRCWKFFHQFGSL